MKNTIKNFVIIFSLLTLLPVLSGCYDFEFPEIDWGGSGYYGGYYSGWDGSGYSYPVFTHSEMSLDSTALVSDNTMLFWASIHFTQDTILYVQKYEITYSELEQLTDSTWAAVWPVGKIKSLEVTDTLNFATNNMEPFIISMPMDTLKPTTYYTFNPGGAYTTPDGKTGWFSGSTLMMKTE